MDKGSDMTAPPREPGCIRVCPVRDRECREPEICDQRKTGCQMLIELPPELDHLRSIPAPSAESMWNRPFNHVVPPAAQPAKPCKPCDNVDQFGQECHLHKGHIGNHRRAPAEPPAKVVTRCGKWAKDAPVHADCAYVCIEAAAEPPATDDLVAHVCPICDTSFSDMALSVANKTIYRQAREIAEEKRMTKLCRDAEINRREKLRRAEAERDALRDVVKASDAMRKYVDLFEPGVREYDAARAKVGKP